MTIRVNGADKTVDDAAALSYEQILAFAGMSGTPSMTFFWHAPGKSHHQRSGVLAPGGTVEAEPFMSFTVAHTDNA